MQNSQYPSRSLLCAETNIDDMNPEFAPIILESLLSLGARDAWLTPIIMKRGRPAFCLHVLFDEEYLEAVTACVLGETTSLGIRVFEVTRYETERQSIAIETEYGPISVKVALSPQGMVTSVKPELSDCEQAARTRGIAVKEVYHAALLASLSFKRTAQQQE